MLVQDWLGKDNELGVSIWTKKYQQNDESFDDWLVRVSGGDEKVAQLIIDKKFLFGGRILSNRGIKDRGVTYSNCYVIEPPYDSIEGIYDTAMKLARTFSYGGGCGVDISTLRPKGSEVHNAAKTTSGAVSFMDVFEQTARVIGQNGRRGALMLSMDSSHPDIHDFIDAKLDNKLEKCNISVRMSDEDMANREDILDHIAKNNYDWAEPGMLYWDTITRYNLLDEFANFEYAGVNPCIIGDTIIQTTDGPKMIKDLVGTQPDVLCMSNEGKLIIKKATKVWKTRKNANLVEVDFNRGKLICTPDHKIFTRNRGWVEAKDLHSGDKLNGLGISMSDEKHCNYKLSSDNNYHSAHRFILSYYQNIKGKDVHHLDGNPLNNAVTNLVALNHNEHSKITNIGHECYANKCEVTGQFIQGKTGKRTNNLEVNKQALGKNFIVKSVKVLNYTEDVYDMTVQDVHNFIANNIVIHNCAEEPLPAGGSCLLGALNLSAFVKQPFTDKAAFSLPEFKSAVRIAIRALNNVLDEGLELHPLEEQRESVRDWRQIGLGIMGFADMLLMMNCQYDSARALDIIDMIGKTLVNTGLEESAILAKETQSFPECDLRLILASTFITVLRNSNVIEDNTINLIKLYGLANSQLFTIAPTGSISTMLGVSGGVEPIFATHYTRKTQSLHGEDVYYNVYTPIIQKMIDLELVPEEKVCNIATAQNIDPFDRVTIQAKWQRYIDASISSTVNVTNDTSVETIKELYQSAWEEGCKGLTVYRAGCKKEGVLVVDTPKEQPKEDPIHIPITDTSIDNCVAYGTQLTTGCGSLWMTVYFHKKTGQLCHIFLDKGSQGGCNSFMIGLSRLISLAGKKGATVEEIVDQLKSVSACPSYTVRTYTKKDTSPGKCCPSAIGKALLELNRRYIADHVDTEYKNVAKEDATVSTCPECGAKLNFTGGCNSCPECGYTKCD